VKISIAPLPWRLPFHYKFRAAANRIESYFLPYHTGVQQPWQPISIRSRHHYGYGKIFPAFPFSCAMATIAMERQWYSGTSQRHNGMANGNGRTAMEGWKLAITSAEKQFTLKGKLAVKNCLASDSSDIHAVWPKHRETPCLNSSRKMWLLCFQSHVIIPHMVLPLFRFRTVWHTHTHTRRCFSCYYM